MRRFLLQLGIVLTCLLTWGMVNDQVIHGHVLAKSFQEHANVEHVVIGDSHGATIWLDNCLNMSKSGDIIFVQYLFLQQAFQHLDNVQHLWISVGPQNVSTSPLDRFMNNADNYLVGNGRRIATIVKGMSHTELSFAMSQVRLVHELIPVMSMPFLTELPRKRTTQRLTEDYALKALRKHHVLDSDWFVEHDYTTGIYRAIADISPIEVHFVGTPLHSTYRRRLSQPCWDRYQRFFRDLAQAPNVHYHALEATDLPDSYFQDADHLNIQGVKWLTDTLSASVTMSSRLPD